MAYINPVAYLSLQPKHIMSSRLAQHMCNVTFSKILVHTKLFLPLMDLYSKFHQDNIDVSYFVK